MSYKLTYSTMFNPPEDMHQRFEAALNRTRAGLGARHGMFVDGQCRTTGRYATKRSPIDQQLVLGEFALGTEADADLAMDAAARAFPAWRATPWPQRVAVLRRAAALVEERVYDIAAALALEVGKNRMESLGEVQEVADFFRIYAEQMEKNDGHDRPLPDDPLEGWKSHNRSVMKPYGPWLVVVPYNFPFALAGGPVGAALVAGNTVVLKGASDTPWAGRLLVQLLHDAGVPAGAVNYVMGPGRTVGQRLVEHPATAGVTFTGSYETGMHLVRSFAAGRYPRPVIAEMGGKNAVIVTRHADLARAATGIVRSAYGLSGQKCSALSRIYVDRTVAGELKALLVEQIGALKVGDPTQRAHWMGPVATAQAHADFGRHMDGLRHRGARLLAGGDYLRGEGLERGLFCAPTLAEAALDDPLWQHEMFLPVAMLAPVADREQAMALANASDMGLTAGFYGGADELPWFFEHIESGVTYANRPQGATTGAWPGYQPFGGWKGSGSTGKALASFHYLPQYLREQSQTYVE
ncbi:MAG: aldehyde dehydrogenase family protein [Burkholderiaceae bacterium]